MKKIRIFDTPWHVSANYSLINIPNTEWGLLKNNVRQWNSDARPIPKNAHFVPYYEKGKYDLAILHVDQQCIDPLIGKGILYRNLNEVIQDIPKIVVNHGTPWWPERWQTYGQGTWTTPPQYKKRKDFEAYHQRFLIDGGVMVVKGELEKIEGMKKLIGDNTMVVNSHRAKEMWGWGEVIIHGLDKDEWFDLPKEPRVVTGLSAGGLDSYYGRDFLQKTKEIIHDRFGLRLVHIGDERDWTIDRHYKFNGNAQPRWSGFKCYRDFLGRSLIYFNPTQESPMPRSRTEAMLSGCCVLTTPFHDADSFINCDLRDIWKNSEGTDEFIRAVDGIIERGKDIVNGFLVPTNPLAIAALVNHLIYNRFREAEQIGANGKKTAQEIFSKKRYDSEWISLINKVLGGKK